MRTRFLSITVFILVLIVTYPSIAQVNFPVKPIQLLVGFAAGGTTDILARTLAQEAKKHLGQEVVIVNKVGAGGIAAIENVTAAKPDGYTLGATMSPSYTLVPFFNNVFVDPAESTPILSFAKFTSGILVRSDSPFKTLKDFLQYARENPGKATYAHPGVGTRPHMVMAAIAGQDGIKMNFVPFKGDTPSVTALLGGHVMACGGGTGSWKAHVQAGTLRLLAVMEEERVDLFPETPTIVELGYSYPFTLIVFVHGPKGLPEPVVKKLEDAFSNASQSPVFTKVAVDNALYVKKPLVRGELAKFLSSERTKSEEIIKKLGLKAD